MSPPLAVAAVAAVIAAGTYLVAVLDHLFSGRVGGERLGAGALLAPVRRGALLLLQRRTTTERPDAEAWALAPPLLAGLGAVALTAIPLAPGMAIADVPAGIVLFGAALVQVMVAVFLHGWGSNSAFPLIGAGSGGGRADRVLEWMRQELAGIDYDGEVRIVRYRGGTARADRGGGA